MAQLRIPDTDHIFLGEVSDSGVHSYLWYSVKYYTKMQWKLDNNRQFRIAVDGTYATIDGINHRIRFYNPLTDTYNSIQARNIVQRSPASTAGNGNQSVNNGLSRILGLEPVTISSAATNATVSNERELSFNVSSIRESIPELLTEDSKGNCLLDVNGMIPLLVNSVQTLDTQAQLLQKEFEGLNHKARTKAFDNISSVSSSSDAVCTLGIQPLIKNRCTVAYTLPHTYRNAVIKICSQSGHTVYEKEVFQNEKIRLECESWNPGVYICMLVVDGIIVKSQKSLKK